MLPSKTDLSIVTVPLFDEIVNPVVPVCTIDCAPEPSRVISPLIVTVLFKSVALVTVNVPVTEALSSIVVVPPAESRVKLPEVVSISLSPVTPILILPAVAPANVGEAVV